MRTCLHCKVEKDDSVFIPYKNRKGERALTNTCLPCKLEINRQWRVGRQEKYNENARTKRHERKQRMVKYKGGVCTDCLQSYHWCAMDFHHVDASTKHTDPGLLMGRSDDFLKKEIDKCVLLCANCHRIRHFTEGY